MDKITTETNLRPEEQATLDRMKARAEGAEAAEAQEEEKTTGRLAGKFDSPEQLEKAYLELQRKLGQPRQQEDEEADEEDDDDDDAGDEEDDAGEEESTPDSEEDSGLSDDEVAEVMQVAGGEDEYKAAIKWASDNLSNEEVDDFNAVLDSNNVTAIRLAVRQLTARYRDDNGKPARKIVGKARPSRGPKPFESREQLRAAMADPRYQRDPAYRNAVAERLKASIGRPQL